jgi:uncharacterized membrane protein
MNGLSSRNRVLIALGVGVIFGGAVGLVSVWQLAVLVGWSAAGGFWLFQVWFRVRNLDPDDTRRLATREDNSRTSASVLLVTACLASLVGAAFGLLKSHEEGATLEVLLNAAVAVTVVLSWTVVHAVFMLRYAHEYYSPHPSGIDFKSGDYCPDYRDFAYVAFTVGMTFQVSDTDINNGVIRYTVLRHALLSYLFGAVIVALMVNIIAGLLR